MTPPGPVDLRTPHLRLRTPEDGDAAELLAIHASANVNRGSSGLPRADGDARPRPAGVER